MGRAQPTLRCGPCHSPAGSYGAAPARAGTEHQLARTGTRQAVAAAYAAPTAPACSRSGDSMILSVFVLQTTPGKRKQLSKSYQFSHSTQGFTLVETLVALALVSLPMLGMAGALRILAQT